MISPALIKPTHKAIVAYYEKLQGYDSHNVTHEMALRSAFQQLLEETGKSHKWTLIPEQTVKVGGKSVRPDGTFRDEWHLPVGYWEAKDTADDLNAEIRAKIAKGYPAGQHDLRGHPRGGPVPERQGGVPHPADRAGQARRSAQCVLRPFQARHRELQAGRRAFPGADPRPRPGAQRADRRGPQVECEVQGRLRRLLRIVSSVAQPEPPARGGRRDAGPAPADRTAVSHGVRQPRFHQAERRSPPRSSA